ncbi:MAG: 3,4-dihydroxy-2-butanone-4-phosphate synthase [Thermoplasmatales archaeon]|nr:MAG: 3,4-dihydroxy-2-butanone-4-phosphate synthase [Thermoplasmatales archaeon]
MKKINKALTDLQKGKFVLIYDSENREGETDFVMASQFVTPESVKRMRKDGGGLIFLMTSKEVADRLQLPFLAELYADISDCYPVLKEIAPNDIPYDTKSSFSLYINHRDTFTGITDKDRSLTMRKFAELIKKTNNLDIKSAIKEFGREFRSPGHVPMCVASENLLNERKGHTELVIAALQMAGLVPAGSGCEIMGNNGRALSKEDAIRYAEKNNFVFLEGKEIIQAWKQWSK